MQTALQKWCVKILLRKDIFLLLPFINVSAKIGNSPLGVRGKRHSKNSVGEFYEAEIVFYFAHFI
jgi:hypothetical protein